MVVNTISVRKREFRGRPPAGAIPFAARIVLAAITKLEGEAVRSGQFRSSPSPRVISLKMLEAEVFRVGRIRHMERISLPRWVETTVDRGLEYWGRRVDASRDELQRAVLTSPAGRGRFKPALLERMSAGRSDRTSRDFRKIVEIEGGGYSLASLDAAASNCTCFPAIRELKLDVERLELALECLDAVPTSSRTSALGPSLPEEKTWRDGNLRAVRAQLERVRDATRRIDRELKAAVRHQIPLTTPSPTEIEHEKGDKSRAHPHSDTD